MHGKQASGQYKGFSRRGMPRCLAQRDSSRVIPVVHKVVGCMAGDRHALGIKDVGLLFPRVDYDGDSVGIVQVSGGGFVKAEA